MLTLAPFTFCANNVPGTDPIRAMDMARRCGFHTIELSAIDGISEVYSVTGRIDLIAIVRVASFDDVAPVVADALAKVPGVRQTETHLAFRAYSRHDLDATFSIGISD